jgi:hypothetical protein
MASPVEAVLTEIGPSISSRITAKLIANGMKADAARQRVSRAKGNVKRLFAFSLPKGEKFLYLETQFNTDGYWEALARDIDATKSVYGAAFHSLLARGGMVPRPYFDIISGAPIKQKGQVSSVTVLQRMQTARLVSVQNIGSVGEVVVIDCNSHYGSPDVSVMRARLITENILLLAVKDWVRRLAMVSYNKVAIRDPQSAEPPTFSTCRWDLCGPSYLRPFVKLNAGSKIKPGFVVCDTSVGRRLAESEIRYFLRKCQLVGSFLKVSPYMPILVADGFTKEAFSVGRGQGIIMATPRSLFGKEVAEALRSLLSTLTRAAAVAAKNPDKINELFSKLGAIEGAAANLRGALFEMIVGFLVNTREGNSIDLNETVFNNENGDKAEIDVRRIKEKQECWCYECKGHQPGDVVTEDMVKAWIKKVNVIYGALRKEKRFASAKFGFEYWTCGTFDPAAIAYLETEKTARKKITLHWRNGNDVRAYAATINHKSIMDTLDEHYFNHPVNVFMRRNSKPDDFDALPPELQYDNASDEDFDHTADEFKDVEDLEDDLDDLEDNDGEGVEIDASEDDKSEHDSAENGAAAAKDNDNLEELD